MRTLDADSHEQTVSDAFAGIIMPCPASNSRCGCDFSTRAEQKPNLTSIEVVSDIFFQASQKSAQRVAALEKGEMSPEEYALAEQKLTDWIGATFAGANSHYESSEGWNPSGLAQHALLHLSSELQEFLLGDTDNASDVVFALARLYRRDLNAAFERHVTSGARIESFALSESSLRLIHWWSRLMTGAPTEFLLHR